MEKEYNEPEEKQSAASNATVIQDKDMLTDEEMINRGHATGNSGTSATPVSEWAVPPVSDMPPSVDDESGEQPKETTAPYANEQLKDLPDSEKQKGAMMAAGAIVDTWEGIWRDGANMLLLFSDRKLHKLEAAGEIDLSMPVKTQGGNITSAGQLFELHNETTRDCVKADPDFKEMIVPMIAEELAKRNIGLTNMQMIAVLAAKDAKTKVEAILPSYHMKQDILTSLKEATKYWKTSGQPVMSAAPQFTTSPAAAEQQPENNNEPSPVFNQPVQNTQPPMQEQVVYGPQRTNTAFDEIQGARGGGMGSMVPMQAVPNLAGQVKVRNPRKKYKKRKPVQKNKF